MRKLLIAALAALITGISQAEVKIAVNGVVDNNPEAEFNFSEQPVNIGIWSDGDTPADYYFIGIGYYPEIYSIGAEFSSLDISQASMQSGSIEWSNDSLAPNLFVKNPFAMIWFDAPSAPGMLAENINFSISTYDELGLVVFGKLTSYDDTWGYWNGVILDTKGLRPIPEPITIVLLGLGGLILKRHRQ